MIFENILCSVRYGLSQKNSNSPVIMLNEAEGVILSPLYISECIPK